MCIIVLEKTKRTHPELLKRMSIHYSNPKGFVGRNLCYAIYYDNIYYGHIVGGSATLHLPNRNQFFNTDNLKSIVNNIFYNVSKVNGRYPSRNFTTKVLKSFMNKCAEDWEDRYGDRVIGFETLVELPRKGVLYRKAGFEEIGITKGYTCKRYPGKGTDNYTGRRVWNTKDLRPKRVLVKRYSYGNL